MGLSGPKAIAHDIEHVFVRPARAQHDAVMALHHDEPADVLLTDPAYAGGALVLGHARTDRPPLLVCGVLPLTIASRDTAPYGMGLTPLSGPLGVPLGRLRNRLLGAVAARTVFSQSQRLADEVHREIFGRPLAFPVLDWPRHAETLAQFTVQEFEYPRSDAPSTLHFVGPLSATGSQAPRPDWWSDLDGSRPVVHVTQGTIANRDLRQVIGPTLEALADDDLLVVVTTGGRPLDTLPPLPANARAAEYLPYDDLLPKTDVYVTNGGYGGVQYALRHGVPIVTSGGQEDKPEVAVGSPGQEWAAGSGPRHPRPPPWARPCTPCWATLRTAPALAPSPTRWSGRVASPSSPAWSTSSPRATRGARREEARRLLWISTHQVRRGPHKVASRTHARVMATESRLDQTTRLVGGAR